jgi:alginate O-acetyltransferase complex protein AlgI
MQFNEPTFLFLFLPVVLALYHFTPVGRNAVLFGATLLFLAWAGQQTIFLLLAAILFNYSTGLVIARSRSRGWLTLGIAINLLLLIWCKYATFLHLPAPPFSTPPGLSFFTFVAIAYLVDIFRGEAAAITNPLHAGNYFVFFSRALAGPIVRYRDIGSQLATRPLNRELFATGVRRFIIGLGKKVLIANTVGVPVDRIFALPANELTAPVAWLGVICYTVQIFFDFAGYTDMAIGVGAMFGFKFPENFNYPYTATSVRDFWRRWHMTLSGWLRDYLYIPLGGSRCAAWRVYFNLALVFFLCGLWHGAAWTFVVWGLIQGFFLLLERATGNKDLPRPVGYIYALAVTMLSWVFFRAASLPAALAYLATMFGVNHATVVSDGWLAYATTPVLLALAAGVIGSTPVVPTIRRQGNPVWETAAVVALAVILFAAVVFMAASTYTPFIYQQF